MKAMEASPHASSRPEVCMGLPAYQLLRAAGIVPVPTMPELVRSLWEPYRVAGFNKFIALSDVDCGTLKSALVLWLELCVLENKLERLERMARAMVERSARGSDANTILPEIRGELRVTRGWSAAENPQWLAFEVDGGIQIRPEQ